MGRRRTNPAACGASSVPSRSCHCSRTATAMTIREVVETTGLPKTTVLRIVQTLENNGLLAATPSGYVAGPGLWRWAHLAKHNWEPTEGPGVMRSWWLGNARPLTSTSFTAWPACALPRREPDGAAPCGARRRRAAAVGRRLLEGAFTRRPAQPPGADRPLRTHRPELPSHVEKEIANAAADGYGISHDEREVGLSAVAVPIPDAEVRWSPPSPTAAHQPVPRRAAA